MTTQITHIVDPKTNKKIHLKSSFGQTILNNYIDHLSNHIKNGGDRDFVIKHISDSFSKGLTKKHIKSALSILSKKYGDNIQLLFGGKTSEILYSLKDVRNLLEMFEDTPTKSKQIGGNFYLSNILSLLGIIAIAGISGISMKYINNLDRKNNLVGGSKNNHQKYIKGVINFLKKNFKIGSEGMGFVLEGGDLLMVNDIEKNLTGVTGKNIKDGGMLTDVLSLLKVIAVTGVYGVLTDKFVNLFNINEKKSSKKKDIKDTSSMDNIDTIQPMN